MDKLGNITLYNDDCMNLLREFPDRLFDLAIVDPPYFDGPEKLGYYGTTKSSIGVKRPTIALAAKRGLLPTPTVNDATNASLPISQAKRKSGMAKMAMKSDEYLTGAGSRLNPLYVTEMMGFPVNWLVSPFLRGAENRSKPAETP